MSGFDFIVLGKAAIGAQPGECSLHDPTVREQFESTGRFLDDLNVSGLAKLPDRSLVGVGKPRVERKILIGCCVPPLPMC